jgi:hypothetical protein
MSFNINAIYGRLTKVLADVNTTPGNPLFADSGRIFSTVNIQFQAVLLFRKRSRIILLEQEPEP